MFVRARPGSGAIPGRAPKSLSHQAKQFVSSQARNCKHCSKTCVQRGLTGANDLPQNLRGPSLEPIYDTARPRTGFGGWWLNGLLFVLTLATTTIFGAAWVTSFEAGRAFDLDVLWESYQRFFHGNVNILLGLRFSGPLLLILLAHEFGHFVACRYWRVDASLPYFIPSPSLFGTWGVFIRIRSPIYSRNGLFDIGISGPIAGFVVLAPFLCGCPTLASCLSVQRRSHLSWARRSCCGC